MPILFGYLSVAFAFGMLAVQSGFAIWTPCVISLSSFTGTGQFVGVDLMSQGAMFTEIAFTILIVNLRYLLMGLSLSQKLDEKVSLWGRLWIAFGDTDEIFAVAMQQKEPLNIRYMSGLILTAYFGWTSGTLIGALAGTALPESVQSALGIAIYAMFIAIVIPSAKDSSPVAKVSVIALVMGVAFYYVPGLNCLSSGWVIIICGVVSSAIGAYFFTITSKQQEEEGVNNES